MFARCGAAKRSNVSRKAFSIETFRVLERTLLMLRFLFTMEKELALISYASGVS